MRNPSFLLAAMAALIGIVSVALAIFGTHGPYTLLIVVSASLITLAAATHAIRAIRRARS